MMKSCKTLCVIFIAIFPWKQIAFAQTPDKINEVENNLSGVQGAEKDSAWNITSRMRHYGVKGVSIALIHNYQIEWTKGYGWADEEARRPVTAETRFQAASISKSLNAVGVLKLVQNDKLDLYTDINQYLTDWKFPYDVKAKDKKISTIELLSHTAGLNVHGFEGYQRGADLPSVIQILDGLPPANSPAIRSVMEPGLRSEYSGGGVTISQLIVMDITKMPYAAYMQNEVLNPMVMVNSSYEQPTRIDSTMLTTGYRENGNEVPGKYHVYPEQAAAGLWTTPADLAKYII
ncbi:MAG TPA: serine hydrolase domain-containing protein, partial [Puia sp.]|nr:serine hydrolase domain-containing protein [Puia sp.]